MAFFAPAASVGLTDFPPLSPASKLIQVSVLGRKKTLIKVKRNASSRREEEPRGWGKGEDGKQRGQKGEKGERKEEDSTQKEVGAPKVSKIKKQKIKLQTNLMDITEAEFPPEVQNMRAVE